ncbi:Protein of unknown function [Gryllus bimaculatus]|nr:Protein of unknown function [Gryllus bimaculatus]
MVLIMIVHQTLPRSLNGLC